MIPLIIGNWKCNPASLKEAKKLFLDIKKGLASLSSKSKKAKVVISAPFVFLSELKKISDNNLDVGAQDCFWENKGPFTGEISPLMLKTLGINYVIVGHSKRREVFNETDEIVNKKLKAVLSAGLSPVFCVGETLEQREKGETEQILKRQLTAGLDKIPASRIQKIIFVYEPIWAISTSKIVKVCDFEEAHKMQLLERKIIGNLYNSNISQKMTIIYGGSANSKNARGYIKEAQMQGLLPGAASLDAEEFVKTVKESL